MLLSCILQYGSPIPAVVLLQLLRLVLSDHVDGLCTEEALSTLSLNMLHSFSYLLREVISDQNWHQQLTAASITGSYSCISLLVMCPKAAEKCSPISSET